jgi:Regulator of ribonuclease activity B
MIRGEYRFRSFLVREEKDKVTIEAFQAQRGADRGFETGVRHYLYVDRRRDAERIGKDLAADGFKIEVRLSGGGEKWLILVTHKVSVTDKVIDNFRGFFDELVNRYRGGEYDGWEAEI